MEVTLDVVERVISDERPGQKGCGNILCNSMFEKSKIF